jgi:hypothetical protein
MYFCDHAEPVPPSTDAHDGELGFQCTWGFNGAWYVSDNAGPGQGAGNPYIGAGIAQKYRDIGHLFCGSNGAWNCMGSSHAFFSGTEKASGSVQGGDWAWHQQFWQNSGGLGWSEVSWPVDCNAAYWVPQANFFAWLNNTWLGHPRSSYYFSPGYGWFQAFKNGYMLATTFGGTPAVLSSPPNICSA